MSTTTQFSEKELAEIGEKHIAPRFAFMPVGLVFAYFSYICWPVSYWEIQTPWVVWSVQALWVVLFSWIMLCWTSCFHETAHQTLTTSRSVSIWLGRCLGVIIFVPYTVYRESHIRHHAYLNTPKDWELWPYSDPQTSLGFRRAFVWFDLLLGLFTAPYIYGRTFFHKNSPIQNPKLRRTVYYEYLAALVFWGSIIGVVAYTGYWKDFMLMWVIPHLIAGFLQNGRKLTEHLGMSSYDPLQGTRTVMGGNWFTRMCTYFNFDIFIHGPHHRHPRVAHNKLQEKMDAYMQTHPDLTYPIYPSYTKATLAMIPNMWRCPGVGMNAGAVEHCQDAEDVEDFVPDVVRDLPPNQHLETSGANR